MMGPLVAQKIGAEAKTVRLEIGAFSLKRLCIETSLPSLRPRPFAPLPGKKTKVWQDTAFRSRDPRRERGGGIDEVLLFRV